MLSTPSPKHCFVPGAHDHEAGIGAELTRSHHRRRQQVADDGLGPLALRLRALAFLLLQLADVALGSFFGEGGLRAVVWILALFTNVTSWQIVCATSCTTFRVAAVR